VIGEVSEESEIEAPARVVERFLRALHQEDWGAATAAMDERIVYDNVGYPTINGSHGVMRFWHRVFGRPSAGFEAKIHRIAVDGLSVLTERTEWCSGRSDFEYGSAVSSRCGTTRSPCGATISTCWTWSRPRSGFGWNRRAVAQTDLVISCMGHGFTEN
jgi:limonene-1,2-epoxide hydrolase